MKVYISVDMEGISGVVGSYQVLQASGALPEVRRRATAEVNAAVEAAYEAGAELVLANENHSGKDLILEDLHPQAEVLMGKPKPLMTLQDLDETFSAVFLIGIHARAGTPQGVLDHTWHPKIIREMRVNGYPVGEIGLNALVAGHYGVPVTLVVGDQAAVEEAKRLLKRVEGVVVKHGVDRYAARLYHPSRTQAMIREAAGRALASLSDFHPFSLGLPAQLELDLADTALAERVAMIPTAARVGARTVSFPCEDYVRLMKNLIVSTTLAKGVMDPVY